MRFWIWVKSLTTFSNKQNSVVIVSSGFVPGVDLLCPGPVQMAANRVGRRVNKVCGNQSPGRSLQRRQARVTVKYNRQELQRRLDTEKWIDCGLDQLYQNQELEIPDEVNIDELLDLKTDEERTHRLKEILCSCNSSTESFISELLAKLQGLQKQEDLHNDGIYPARSGSASRGALSV